MKITSESLLEAISSRRYQARQCVTIEVHGTKYYFTSHADITTPDPANTFASKILKLNSISQKNMPENRISTIGDFNFELSDKGQQVTTWLRDRDLNDEGLRDAKVQLLIGSAGLDFADYAPAVTQYIKRISHNNRRYRIKARDGLRFISKTIFSNLRQTNLIGELNETATTIDVVSTDGFDMVAHGTSYKDGTAGQTVGYLYLEGEDGNGTKYSEVIYYTGKTATSFTGCQRGALNTRPRKWAGPDGSNAGTVVKEHIFLQMPAPKLAWALMTGELYGQPGETLPDHWHAKVDATSLDLASFEQYGIDVWNPADDSRGTILRFDGIEEENSKEFIEQEILPLIGGSLIIQGDGELALNRTVGVVTDAPVVMTLTEKQIFEVGEFERNLEDIYNQFLIGYSWRRDLKEHKRKHGFIDVDSVNRNYLSPSVKYLAFKGLNYDSHNLDVIQNLMTPLRDRLSNETIRVSIGARLTAAVVEVGQAVGIRLANWQDYTSTGAINRAFEVQQKTVNWLTGRVTLSLFGTSQRAAPLPPVRNASSPVDHTGWVAFASVLQPGTFTDDGTTLTITGNNTLTGFATAATDGVVTTGWYYDGHVIFAGGSVTSCDGHFILDAVGDITVNGDLDTTGGGVTLNTDHYPTAYNAGLIRGPYNRGESVRARRTFRTTNSPSDQVYVVTNSITVALDPVTAPPITPVLDENGRVTGIPDILHGQPGINSEPSSWSETNYDTDQTTNLTDTTVGQGGASGGGVLLMCDHLYGEGIGKIITNGEDGQEPSAPMNVTFSVADNKTVEVDLWAANGAGGYPGAVYVLQKTNDATADLGQLVEAKLGASGYAAGAEVLSQNPDYVKYDGLTNQATLFRYYATGVVTHEQYSSMTGGLRGFSATLETVGALEGGKIFNGFDVGRVVYLANESGDQAQPGDIAQTDALAPVDLTLQRKANTANALLNSTIITATVTPPSDTNYSHALFEVRNVTTNSPWQTITYKTPNEATVEVASAGDTFEIRARSVSKTDVVSEVGLVDSIAAYTITTDPATSDGGQADPDPELTLADITGLELVNRLGDSGGQELQFKSGNAEFKWDKTAASFDGKGVALDPHFAGYVIEIHRVNPNSTTTKVRDAVSLDNKYTYTLEQNRKDDCGRKLQFKVFAQSTGGYQTPVSELEVENPAPAAPSNISIQTGYTAVKVRFDVPDNDLDFVGVDAFVLPGAGGDVYSETTGQAMIGNTFSLDGLTPFTSYKIGLQSRDQFGLGGQSTQIDITTLKVPGATLTEITGPVTINDSAGWLATDNAGYQMFIGAIDRPSIHPVTLIAHAYDSTGESSSFFVDVAGFLKATNADIGGKITVGSGSSGFANLADRPIELSDLNATEGAKLAGIAPGADQTQAALESGTEIGSGYLHLNGTNAQLAIGASTSWQSQGIQFQYNSGTPRFYAGDGARKYLEFDGDDVILGPDSTVVGSDSYNTEENYWLTQPWEWDVMVGKASGSSVTWYPNLGYTVMSLTRVNNTPIWIQSFGHYTTTRYLGLDRQYKIKLRLNFNNALLSGDDLRIKIGDDGSGKEHGVRIKAGTSTGLIKLTAYSWTYNGSLVYGSEIEVNADCLIEFRKLKSGSPNFIVEVFYNNGFGGTTSQSTSVNFTHNPFSGDQKIVRFVWEAKGISSGTYSLNIGQGKFDFTPDTNWFDL